MKRTLLTVVAASLVTFVLCGGIGGAPIYDLDKTNALIRTALQVNGTTTTNGTETANGVVSRKSLTKNLAIATRLPGTTSTTVSVDMPDSTYAAYPETNNTSPSVVSSKTATVLTLTHATIGTTDTAPVELIDY